MGIDLIKDMAEAVKATARQQERTSPYDTSAEVRRIEGGTQLFFKIRRFFPELLSFFPCG